MGCQNKHLPVPKCLLRKMFFIEKKILLKFGNWAKKTWPLAQLVSVGLTKLYSTCLEEPFEKNCLKSKGFFLSTCLDREQKNFGLLDKSSGEDVKISFYVSTRTILGNFCLKISKIFKIFWPLSRKFEEQSRGEASRRVVGNFVTSKNILGGHFDVSETLWIRKAKPKAGITLFL